MRMDFTDPVITGMSVSTAISSITKTQEDDGEDSL
jgi:hypothetical protein